MPMYLGDVVSDEFLQDLLRSYRQGYTDARGPDFEDSDAPLLSQFASAQVRSNATAYQLGAQQAAIDIANKEDVHATAGFTAGAPTPTQRPPNPPSVQTAMPERSDAEVYATFQRSAGLAPSNTTSGPVAAGGYASFPQLSGYTQGGAGASGFSIFGLDMTTLLIIAAIGVGAYLMLKKG